VGGFMYKMRMNIPIQAAFPVLYDDTTLLGIGLSMIPSYLTR
jgi:hypothetical protein